MLTILFIFLSSTVFNPMNDIALPEIIEEDVDKRVCIEIMGKKVICIVVEASFLLENDGLRLEGDPDFETNRMRVTGFPKSMNGKSFEITEPTYFTHEKGKTSQKYMIAPKEIKINRGTAWIIIESVK